MSVGSKPRLRWGCGVLGALLFAAGCSQDVASESEGGGRGDAAVDVREDAGDEAPVTREDASQQPRPTMDAGGTRRPDSGPKSCNQASVLFGSADPTVFILVDRSSSMFQQNFWEPLKAGVLEVVRRLEGEVYFGFGTYTGQAGGTCPDVTKLDRIAKNNHAAIKQAYDALAAPTYKGETPTSLAVEAATALLEADQGVDVATSPQVILLVTDGEPDFCDDSNVTCARDAVVAAVQTAQSRGIATFIFSIGGQVDRAHLGDVANAGVGQPVSDRQNAVMNQCPQRRATYSATSGNAPYFEPNVNNQDELVRAIESVVARVRSCVFDLAGQVEIDLAEASQGVVEIDGMRVPHGGSDGFRMNSPTQLELLGGACERLRSPGLRRVFIDFPCEAIVIR